MMTTTETMAKRMAVACKVTVNGRSQGTYNDYQTAMLNMDKFSEWAEWTTMPLSEVARDISRVLGAE
jgi:hypothetical protein